ncbi:MAG: hypothetical protein JWN39_4134, partial [Ilumatobacteraceae bacterium]|nr:hypothetical protein [Ilumatobacteraceae bacterium]
VWFPNQTDDARINFPDGSSEQVPTTVADHGLRLALGRAVSSPPPVGGKQTSSPPMNELVGSSEVLLGTDENVSSTDGIAVADSTPHTLTPVTVAIDRGAVTVTEPDGTAVTGFVDAEGYFVAYNDTENYTGTIDQTGNVVVYRTVVSGPGNGASGFRASPRPDVVGVDVDGDYTIFDLPGQATTTVTTSSLSFLKNHGPPPALPEGAIDTGYTLFVPLLPPLAFAATQGEPAQPAGAQAGGPDWPLLPLTNKPPSAEPDVEVLVAGGMSTDTGQNELLSPWLDAVAITRAPAAPAVVTTTTVTATTTASTNAASASSLPAATTIVTIATADAAVVATSPGAPPTTAGSVPTVVSDASSGSDGSSAPIVIVVVAAVLAAAGAGVWSVARRKRRAIRPAAASAPRVRGVPGASTHRVSDPVAGIGLGVRIAPGPPTHTARHIDPEEDSP